MKFEQQDVIINIFSKHFKIDREVIEKNLESCLFLKPFELSASELLDFVMELKSAKIDTTRKITRDVSLAEIIKIAEEKE